MYCNFYFYIDKYQFKNALSASRMILASQDYFYVGKKKQTKNTFQILSLVTINRKLNAYVMVFFFFFWKEERGWREMYKMSK